MQPVSLYSNGNCCLGARIGREENTEQSMGRID